MSEIKKLKNVTCEYDRLNGWNSTLQAAWYIRRLVLEKRVEQDLLRGSYLTTRIRQNNLPNWQVHGNLDSFANLAVFSPKIFVDISPNPSLASLWKFGFFFFSFVKLLAKTREKKLAKTCQFRKFHCIVQNHPEFRKLLPSDELYYVTTATSDSIHYASRLTNPWGTNTANWRVKWSAWPGGRSSSTGQISSSTGQSGQM